MEKKKRIPPTKEEWKSINATHPNLQNAKISQIVRYFALTPVPHKELARRFSLHPSRISRILRDEKVKEEVERIRAEAFEMAVTRFRGMAGGAVTEVERSVTKEHDEKMALEVLKGLGIAQPKVDMTPVSISFVLPEGGDLSDIKDKKVKKGED